MCIIFREETVMNNMLAKIKQALARFFWGRYGVDKFGYAIVIVSLVISFISTFFAAQLYVVSMLLNIVGYVLLGWALFRMLSKNRQARYNENMKFLGVWKRVKKWWKLQYNRIRDIRTHRYFSCPSCRNNLRVPKGRGDITITCPVCKTKFDRRT